LVWLAADGGYVTIVIPRRRIGLLATIAILACCACAAAMAGGARAATPPATGAGAAPRATSAAHRSHRHALHACHAARRHGRRGRHCHARGTTHRALHRAGASHAGRSHAGRSHAGRSHAGRSHTGRSHAGRSHAAAQRLASPASAAATVTLGPPPQTAETIANVLATPCQNTGLTPEPGNVGLVEAATLCLVNQERARNGELPLAPNAQLQQAAGSHSDGMVSGDYFSHVAPDGETPLARVQAAGYLPNPQAGYTIGENIAWGTLYLATPSAVVAAWIASPEHLANILEGTYRDTGIAVTPAAPPSLAHGQSGAVYTQEFGVVGG
jgi:uncharacterized protein YkwD